MSTLTKAGILAAVAGVAMQVMVSAPAEAFTLAAPSAAPAVAGADIDHVWWDHWGRWHPNRPWGWHPWHRHCWWGPWGYRCGW